MNEAFEKWIANQDKYSPPSNEDAFRAGLLAAAEICEQVGPKEGSLALVTKGFAEAIRELAK